MQGNVKRAFAIVLLTLMLLQALPASLGSALAEGVIMVVGMLESPPQGHFSVAYVDFDDSEIILQYVLGGGASVQPDAPTRPDSEGISYSFSGWRSTPEGISPDNITADVVFRAEYAELTGAMSLQGSFDGGVMPLDAKIGGVEFFEVKFVDHDGTLLHTQYVRKDASAPAVKPQDPTREVLPADGDVAWEFTGWESQNSIITGIDSTITADVAFRATYQKLEMVSFTVHYVLEEHDPSVHIPPKAVWKYKVGETADVYIESPIVPGYKPDDDVITYTGVMGQDPAAETVTVTYARETDVKYNVEYWFEKDDLALKDGEELTPGPDHFVIDGDLRYSDTADYGTTIVPIDQARDGYEMMTLQMEPLIENNTTYNVYYQKKTFTLTYDSNALGVEVSPPVTIKAFDKIILPTGLTRAGYTFEGWRANADGTGILYASYNTMPAEDLTIYGSWIGTTAKYKLVHWVEKANLGRDPEPGNMGDYFWVADTDGLTGATGSTVDEEAVIKKNLKNILTGGTSGKAYAGYQDYDRTATIAGDGSTVINVYYSRFVFTYEFKPKSGTYVARWPEDKYPGMEEDQSLILTFKYGDYLLNFDDPMHSWPYPVTGNEPEYRSSTGTYGGTIYLGYWSIPTSNQFNRRDVLSEEFLPANPLTTKTVVVTPSSIVTNATMTFDLYCFEQLAHQEPLMNEKGPNYTVYSGVTYIHNGITGYSCLARGTTSHSSTGTKLVGCSSAGCDGSAHDSSATYGTYDYGKTYTHDDGKTYKIAKVYFKRNRVDVNFAKNTTNVNIVAPRKITGEKYGQMYEYWPANTLTDLEGWVPGEKPSYTDNSGVKWTFAYWSEYPIEKQIVVLDEDMTIPADPITLYAHWSPQEVEVTLLVNGVATPESPIKLPAYTELKKALPETSPTKEGYEFTGWYIGNVRYADNFQLLEDITLEARFIPRATTYTIRYLDQDNKELRPDYTVSGMYVDRKVQVPDDEQPPVIAGYTLDSTYPEEGSYITLVEDGKNNIITFNYKKFVEYKYNIHYVLLGSDPAFKVFDSDEAKGTEAVQQVIWAKKDPARKYYPVDKNGNPQEMQKVMLDPNKPTDITFFYREYSVIEYAEKSFLYNSSGQVAGTDGIQHDKTAGARIGETVVHSDERSDITYEGKTYTYVEELPVNVQSETIRKEDDDITLVRGYMLEHTIKFTAGANGTLDTTTVAAEQKHLDGTLWSNVAVPTPKAAVGYYFDYWEPSLPTSVTESKTYNAVFAKKKDLVITANSGSLVYNGTEQTLAGGYTFTVSGAFPASDLTLSGISVTPAKGTDVDTYKNAFVGDATSLIITHKTLGNITDQYIPEFKTGALQITKRSLTVAPKDAEVDYTGWPLISPYGNELVVVTTPPALALPTGHTAQAIVSGSGTTPGPYTLSISGGASKVTVMSGTKNVTTNYDISVATGTLTIKGRTASNLIPLSIQPGPVTETYTGNLITATTDEKNKGTVISIDGKAVPTGTSVTFTATGSAKNIGTHGVLAVIDDVMSADKWKVIVNDEDMTAHYTLSPVLKGNLIIELEEGSIPFEITPNPITLPYNGKAQTVNITDGKIKITIDGITTEYASVAQLEQQTGLKLSFTATATQTVPGNYKTTIDRTSVSIEMDGNDVTTGYKKTYNQGDFIITPLDGVTNPKFALSIALNNANLKYNGHTQTFTTNVAKEILVNNTEIGALNKQNGNVLTVTFTATGTGTAPNVAGYPIRIADLKTVVVKLGGVDVTENYDISQIAATLTIDPLTGGTTDPKIPIVISPANRTVSFNGAQQTVTLPDGKTPESGITVGGTTLANFRKGTEPELVVEYKAIGTGFEPRNFYLIEVVQEGVDKLQIMQDGVDVTNNFVPTYMRGQFIILPLPDGKKIEVSITPDDVEKYYTGSTINAAVTSGQVSYSNTGGVTQEVETTFTARGSGVAQGSYTTTIAASDWDVKTPKGVSVKTNYVAKPNTGKLVIKPRDGSAEGPFINLIIVPNNQVRNFSGVEQVVKVTTAQSIMQIDPLVPDIQTKVPSTVKVTFQATGAGTDPNVTKYDYPITIHKGVPGYTDFWAVNTNATPTADVSENYVLAQEPGYLTIEVGKNKPTIVITPSNQEENYNGMRQDYTYAVGDGYTAVFKDASGATIVWPADLTIDAFSVKATDVLAPGTYDLKPVSGSVKITRGGGTDNVAGDYNIVINNAKLTVNKLTGEPNKEPIKIKITPEARQEYFTGKPITVTVTQGDVLHGGNAIADYDVVVVFSATGTGFFPGVPYSTVIDPASFKVYLKNANGTTSKTDVTDNYTLDPQKGALTILEPQALIPMKVTPANRDYDFNNTVQTATISYSNKNANPTQDGTVQITQGSKDEDISLYSALTVTFDAEGSGKYPAKYDIGIKNGMQVTASFGDKLDIDVSEYFKITENNGKLTIKQKKIAVTVGLDTIPAFTYNALAQGFDGFRNDASVAGYGGYAIEVGTNVLADYTIIINQGAKEKDAGQYKIAFKANQVVIMDGQKDITSNFTITPQPGEMVIDPKKLIGKLIANDPAGGQPYTYGDIVLPNGAYYDFNAQGDAGFEQGDAEIPYKVTRTPDGNDAYQNSSSTIAREYKFVPALNGSNKNYDTSGLEYVPSAVFTFARAQLTVTPKVVEQPQYEAKLPLPYEAAVLQHRDTKDTIGLDVVYVTTGDPNDAVGTMSDITKSTGSTQLQNYTVDYENLTNGYKVYGWVEYHGNYPWADPTTKAGKYFDQTDEIELRHPSAYGLAQESLRFGKWTLDKEGLQDVPDGKTIGATSFPVYAQWTQLYQLTVHHCEFDETPIMGDDIHWLEEGEAFTFNAIEYDEFKPEFVEYVSEGVTYRTNIGNFMYMPKEAVEATIYYSRKPKAIVPVLPLPKVYATGDELYEYWLYDMDIPRAGIFSINMGVCTE